MNIKWDGAAVAMFTHGMKWISKSSKLESGFQNGLEMKVIGYWVVNCVKHAIHGCFPSYRLYKYMEVR